MHKFTYLLQDCQMEEEDDDGDEDDSDDENGIFYHNFLSATCLKAHAPWFHFLSFKMLKSTEESLLHRR